MKILIIINSLKPGGAEKQAVVDANALLQRGHQVTVAFHQYGEFNSLLDKDIKQYRIKKKNEILASFQLFCHLLFNKYDIIHSHMFWAEKVSTLPGKLTGHKLIFNEHGLGLWRKWYHILVMKFISIFADKIINSCDATKNIRLKREKINKYKLITVYNSFELKTNKKDIGPLNQFSEDEKEFIIGFVGRFNYVKRLEFFLQIAEILKDKIAKFKIVMVGDGEESKKIKEEILKRNLKNYFYIPGFVLNTAWYYNIFDIFVLPSIREAFSVSLLESGASGITTIAFDVGGNSEIIKDGITGFIIPDGDIDLLVKRIVYLYENPDKREMIGQSAKEYISSNFSIDKRVINLEKLYKEIC